MTDETILRKFGEFGKYSYYMGICILLGLIPALGIVTAILQLYFLIQMLGIIKEVNFSLNNENLERFRSQYIKGILIGVFGSIFAGIVFGISMYFIFITQTMNRAFWGVFIVFMVLLFIAVILMGYFLMKSWENLNQFFEQHAKMVPPNLAQYAIEGTKNLRTASLCYMLFFLIITPLIGFILFIIGYFKLANLRQLEYGTVKPSGDFSETSVPAQEPSYQATPTQPSSIQSTYCPACGTKLRENEKFCHSCRKKID